MTIMDDIERGCLETGESIEARWGTGWWSREPHQEPRYEVVECPVCKEKNIVQLMKYLYTTGYYEVYECVCGNQSFIEKG